jgi:hypothetical protein
MSDQKTQNFADTVHQLLGIPVSAYSFDGSAAIHSRGTAGHRSLSVIAYEIRADWAKPYFGAVPYLEALESLDQVTDRYYEDDAEDVVRYFLANATTWRGETARRIKAELKDILKGAKR